MKFINKYKSNNFNKRRKINNIKYIILHYTAMQSYKEAIKHLCDKKNKVSSHFLINKGGEIFNIVNIKDRAWHAGQSFWQNETDINSCSIGIEIDNSGYHLNFEDYTDKQINSLIKLIKFLKNIYNIKNSAILCHSDISPYRKIDPGEKFPWEKLFKLNISYLPRKKVTKTLDSIDIILDNNFLSNNKERAIYILSKIGFDINPAIKNKKNFNLLIKAYQLHYRSSLVNGKLDTETYGILINHYKDLLTI